MDACYFAAMKRVRSVFVCALFVAVFVGDVVAGNRIVNLGGSGWTCDGEDVSVPHTWNVVDACDGPGNSTMPRNGDSAMSTNSYLRKRAAYRRTFDLDKYIGKRYFIQCEAASIIAQVLVNGMVVGRHVGAFTAFTFEITEAVRNGANELEVVVDNRLTESTQPMSADFSVYGGLYRAVRLIEKDCDCIDPRYPVKARPDPKTGTVKVDYCVNGDWKTQTLAVDDYELWTPENPRLYTLEVRDGTDVEKITVGFRTMEFRDDGFYLNGKKRQLRGVNRHQDKKGKGWAVSPADEEADIRLIKEMGCDALRTAHYPQSQHVYELCDRLGLICWVEYPNVNRLVFSKIFEDGMLAQVKEMVEQLGNHPSIAMWSICNELEFSDAGWMLDPVKTKEMLERTRDFIHHLDPTRPVVSATDKPQGRIVNDVTDQLAYNRYPGWYDDRDMRPILDEMFSVDDRKILGMSEYGVGASIEHHGDPSVRVPTTGLWHPEEYQAWRMHDNLKELQADPRIWGHFVWAMFDFAADRRTEGGCLGLNDKGLVAYDHKTKKDAFYLYQANWTTNAVLHLVGSRAATVTNAVTTVMGFSNVGEVTLAVNGRNLGVRKPSAACGVVWRDVPLAIGSNVVELTAAGIVRKTVWNCTAPLAFTVVPDHPNHLYHVGEEACFSVTANAGDVPVRAGDITATLDNFGTKRLGKTRVDLSRENPFRIKGRLNEPGFLRLTLTAADMKPVVRSVGYEPTRIEKGASLPPDFDAYWAEAKAKLAREIPLDAQMTKVQERSTGDFDYYRISFATFGRRIYGYMSVPTDKSRAPFPVEVSVSAAGFGDWSNDMLGENDRIRVFFTVYPWEPHWNWRSIGLKSNYDSLIASCRAKGEPIYAVSGISGKREDYFFYPVLLGIDRAVDWLAARDDVDRCRFWYSGTSQGGGLGLCLAGLNGKFTRLALFVPAITDTMGYCRGRQGGWPRIDELLASRPELRENVERNAPYFDGANFATRIRCPVRVAVGFADTTCAPCAVYAAFNAIPVADKKIVPGFDMTHSCFGSLYRELGAWLRSGETGTDSDVSSFPIGVFDSGVGGLTVLEKLLSVDVVDNATGACVPDGLPDLQGEKFIQLADQANLHYGSYAAAGSAAFLRELSIRDAFFLLSPGYYQNAAEEVPTGKKTPAKIVVVACNTATAYGFAGIESSIRNIGSPVRVIGVVKAGSRAAVECVRETPESFAVGVLSTPGTFSSGIYPRTIALEAGRLGVASPRVVARGCQNLADSIQFVKPDLEELVRKYFIELVDELRKAGTKEKLRAVIFGCTHYPLARRHFEKVLTELRDDPVRGSFVAEDFTFIDPAVETAIECREILSSEGLLARRMGPSEVAMFVSVPSASLPSGMIGPDGTLEDGYKYSRKPGRDVVDTKFVPLTIGLRDRKKFASLLGILPAVNEHLKGW